MSFSILCFPVEICTDSQNKIVLIINSTCFYVLSLKKNLVLSMNLSKCSVLCFWGKRKSFYSRYIDRKQYFIQCRFSFKDVFSVMDLHMFPWASPWRWWLFWTEYRIRMEACVRVKEARACGLSPGLFKAGSAEPVLCLLTASALQEHLQLFSSKTWSAKYTPRAE